MLFLSIIYAGSRATDQAVNDRYFPKKKPEVFDTTGIPLPPEKLDYRWKEPK